MKRQFNILIKVLISATGGILLLSVLIYFGVSDFTQGFYCAFLMSEIYNRIDHIKFLKEVDQTDL